MVGSRTISKACNGYFTRIWFAYKSTRKDPHLGSNGWFHMNVPLQVHLHRTRTVQDPTVPNYYISIILALGVSAKIIALPSVFIDVLK